MLLAGDEFARTQGGNNNAYCQDNDLTWVGWNRDARQEALARFAQKVTWLRAEHPALRYGRFLGHPTLEDQPRDILWLNASGGEMSGEDWGDAGARAFGMLIDVPGLEEDTDRDVVLLVFNASHEDTAFTLPISPLGGGWERLLDTDLEEDAWLTACGPEEVYQLSGRSVVLFEAASVPKVG